MVTAFHKSIVIVNLDGEVGIRHYLYSITETNKLGHVEIIATQPGTCQCTVEVVLDWQSQAGACQLNSCDESSTEVVFVKTMTLQLCAQDKTGRAR